MSNESGLTPLGHAVLIETFEFNKDGLIEIPPEVARGMVSTDQRARIVEVGAEAWMGEAIPRAISGDIVLVTKFAGFIATGPKDGKTYRLVNDRDIFCRLEE